MGSSETLIHSFWLQLPSIRFRRSDSCPFAIQSRLSFCCVGWHEKWESIHHYCYYSVLSVSVYWGYRKTWYGKKHISWPDTRYLLKLPLWGRRNEKLESSPCNIIEAIPAARTPAMLYARFAIFEKYISKQFLWHKLIINGLSAIDKVLCCGRSRITNGSNQFRIEFSPWVQGDFLVSTFGSAARVNWKSKSKQQTALMRKQHSLRHTAECLTNSKLIGADLFNKSSCWQLFWVEVTRRGKTNVEKQIRNVNRSSLRR